jgi:hypothetical protein
MNTKKIRTNRLHTAISGGFGRWFQVINQVK